MTYSLSEVINKLKDRVELSKQQIKRQLDHLVNMGYVNPERINKGRIDRRVFSEEDLRVVEEMYKHIAKGCRPEVAYTKSKKALQEKGLKIIDLDLKKVRKRMRAKVMAIHEEYTGRAEGFGKYVKTYKDPLLTLMMLKGIHFKLPFRVLDLCCGQGDSTYHLKMMGADVHYLDATEEMIKKGIKRGIIDPDKAIIYPVLNGDLPYEKSSFDIVVSRYALHDILNQKKLLRSLYQILDEKGLLQIVDMCSPNQGTKRFYNEFHMWKCLGKPSNIKILSEREIDELYNFGGFKILDKQWYKSKVRSDQWIKENQITKERHVLLKEIAKKWVKKYPPVKSVFNLRENGPWLLIDFPVIIITGQKV